MSDSGISVGRAMVLRETAKAVVVEMDEEEGDVVIPKSQITDDSEVWKKGQEGDLRVTEWFARKHGWL